MVYSKRILYKSVAFFFNRSDLQLQIQLYYEKNIKPATINTRKFCV
jgi:hypothetical protein